MRELDELERSLLKEIEAKQSELQTVRAAKALLAKKAHSAAQANVHSTKTREPEPASVNGNESLSLLARTADMRHAIFSFRGKKFEAADVTTLIRQQFPTDKNIPKKISRVLYSMKKKGDLSAKAIEKGGS